MFRKITAILLFICLMSLGAAAQTTTLKMKKSGDSRTTGTGSSSMMMISKDSDRLLDVKIDPKASSSGYSKYQDERIKEVKAEMAEREWANEETAWQRAKSEDTKEAYEKYIARFPSGAHRPDASKRLVDITVQDAMDSSHNELPEMKRVESDDDSPKSTIVVENHTDLPMTVYYSGLESRKIIISPWSKGAVTIPNGSYKIAATVPDPTIRPYAGSTHFDGGRYETGYMIVHYQ